MIADEDEVVDVVIFVFDVVFYSKIVVVVMIILILIILVAGFCSTCRRDW